MKSKLRELFFVMVRENPSPAQLLKMLEAVAGPVGRVDVSNRLHGGVTFLVHRGMDCCMVQGVWNRHALQWSCLVLSEVFDVSGDINLI